MLCFVADVWALTKPEINFLIAITVLVGFLAARQSLGLAFILQAVSATVGTLLVSSGGAALNQFMERTFDSHMRRTARRPLVTGVIAPRFALLFGATVSILGIVYIELWVNQLAALIAGFALVIYLLAYTPLKRITPFCTVVGAISGAAPPLIGWAAASGSLDRGAWTFYTLLLLWQFPHFMAIAWMYRDDYERAGYRVLPEINRRLFTAMQAAIPAVLLIPISFVPWFGETAKLFSVGVCLVGLGFAWLALRFALKLNNVAARQLLFASIVYLPIVFALLLFGK